MNKLTNILLMVLCYISIIIYGNTQGWIRYVSLITAGAILGFGFGKLNALEKD